MNRYPGLVPGPVCTGVETLSSTGIRSVGKILYYYYYSNNSNKNIVIFIVNLGCYWSVTLLLTALESCLSWWNLWRPNLPTNCSNFCLKDQCVFFFWPTYVLFGGISDTVLIIFRSLCVINSLVCVSHSNVLLKFHWLECRRGCDNIPEIALKLV